MEEKDKLRSFYDNVSSYLDIGSYDDFYGAMQDPSRRQKFFDNTSQYVDIGDSDKFNSFVGDYFGQQQPAQRVDVSDVEQAEGIASSPYGDLTAENFKAARQRGNELVAQRKQIQSQLDSDTEMEPLTATQRKEYESQLASLDEEMHGVNSFIDAWNKTEGAKAYYEEQKRAVDDVSARVDQMQADYNRERASKRAEEEEKKSWWLRMAEGLAASENPITEEVVAAVTDVSNNDLRTARNEVRNAKNQLQLEEMRMNGEKKGLAFVRGLETANYYELMPVIGMADAMSILQLSKDIKEGKELTDSQKLLKESMEARAGVDFAYQDNNTMWERIGQSAPEQLAFTAQFVLGAGVTGATNAGERVAAKSAERATKRLARKEAKSAARNFVETRVIPELEGMAVSSAIQTFANPLSVAGMVEDFEKRYAGDIYYDKEGNLHVFDDDRSAGQAAYQAIASAWIENFTEYAGGNITKSAKLVDSKLFDIAGKFDNVIKRVGAGKIQDVFKIPQQLGRITQIGSAPEEFLEEELGSVMNALMMTDARREDSYGEAFKNSISGAFAGEQQLETFMSCAITSMLLGSGGNAVNGVRNAGLRKSVNKDVEQSKALLGKVKGVDIEGLDDMIANGRVSDISEYLKEQSDANGWNKDEQGAAVSYVLNRARQIGVKHNDDTAIEAEQAEYRKQAEEMVNRWDGQNIYNVTYTDRDGEVQEGTIVNGRVHYTTNEDGTYTFNPYMSSGMLAIRKADGSVEQVAGRNVSALDNVVSIEEQIESQNQTIDQMMRSQFEQDGMLPTVESVWGGNLVPNVTQFQNGRYTYLGKDENGLYAFANNDKKTSKDNPIVYLTERQLVEYGLSLNLENAQANGDAQAAQQAQDDMDFLKRLDEITADAGEKGQWDVLKAYAQNNVQLDANGDIVPDGSNEHAAAAYLLAISEGSFENAIASVDQAIAALGTPQETEITDNAADNAAMNNAAATVDADKAVRIDFYTNVRNRLVEMQQGKTEADAEEAEAVVANMPVSQMEVGQQFPVEWEGQSAMATVTGRDADGRNVVNVMDAEGNPLQVGIDDMSDADWEAMRTQPQAEAAQQTETPVETPVEAPVEQPVQEQKHPLDDFIAKHGENAQNKLEKTVGAINKEIASLAKELEKAEKELADMPEPYNDKTQKAQDKQEEKIAKLREQLDEMQNTLTPYASMMEEFDRRNEIQRSILNEADEAMQQLDETLTQYTQVKQKPIEKADLEPANGMEFIADRLSGFAKKEYRINKDSLKKETNWGDKEAKDFSTITTTDGGMTVQEMAEYIYGEAEAEGHEHGWFKDPSEVRDALIDLLQSAGDYKGITNYIRSNREAQMADSEEQKQLDYAAQQLGYESGKDMYEKRMAEAKQTLESLKDEKGNLTPEALQQFKDKVAELSQFGIEESVEESAPATQETTVENTEDEDFIQPTDEEAPFSVTGKSNEQIASEYQKRLDEAKTEADRAAVIQEYLDTIGTEPAVVMTNDNYKQILKENKFPERAFVSLESALKDCRDNGERFNAFKYNGKVYMFSEDQRTIEDARTNYVHERQHILTTGTRNGLSLLSRIVNLATEKELERYVELLSGSDFYTRTYRGKPEAHRVYADEFISMAMERAYNGMDLDAELGKLGIKQDLINEIKQLDNEQRTDENLAKARRHSLVSKSRQGDNRKDAGNQGGRPGEVVRQRPGSSGRSGKAAERRESVTGEVGKKNEPSVPIKKLTKEELAVGHKDMFRRQTQGQFADGNGYSYSANFFHIFDNGRLIRSIQIEGNEDLLKDIRHGINENTEDVTGWVKGIRSTRGTDRASYSVSQRQREGDAGADRLYGGRVANSTRDNQEVGRNQSEKPSVEEKEESYFNGDVRYSVVTDPKVVAALDAGEKIKVYRAMQMVDGKLYPPMAGKVNGEWQNPIELGVWEKADERPELADSKGYFKLDKGNGKTIKARYNPYIHTSRSPLNDQFTSAYDRPNLVTVEVEVPASELTSGYKADKAKDAVGEMTWHAGPVSGKLPKDKKRKVILSRYDKPIRVVPDREVAMRIADLLQGEDIAIPYNTVTPSLREELEKMGVKVSDKPNGNVKKQTDEKQNDDVMFSAGTQTFNNGKSLVGMHNISAEKLRKALKLGGLANPSAAVIDIDKQNHLGYGEISLIMPSSLVDSRTGRNAGTYAGDAFTPEYPSVSYHEGKDTEKREKALTKDLPKELGWAIRQGIGEYMDGNRSRSGLEYLFLKEKGQEMPIVKNERRYPDISMEQIGKRLGVEESATRGHSGELYAAYEKLEGDDLVDFNMWFEAYGDEEKIQQRKDLMERNAKVKEMLTEQLGEHMGYGKFDTTWYNVLRDERDAGKENIGRTLEDAAIEIDNQGLRNEFEDWKQNVIDGLGYEEVIFDGYTPSGYRRYVPNTVENASRIMNKKEKTNWLGDAGTHATKAMLLDKFNTLNDIRKNRGLLESDQEVINQAYEEASDAWSELGSELSDMQKVDDNRFINHDIALNRLQEAMMQRDPVAYLNKEYGYSLDEGWNDRIKAVKQQIKSLPSKYFETKFRRPVYLNEFAAAVVPNDLPQDLKDRLQQSGLPLFEYDPNQEGDRRAVTLEATSGDGIRFSVANRNQNIFVSNAERAVEGIKQEKATPEQWLKMVEKSGGLKAGEDKWLGLSEWLKGQDKKSLTKQEVLDFINENAIKIEETHYSEAADELPEGAKERLAKLNEEFSELIFEGDVETESIYTSDWVDYALVAMEEKYGDDFRFAFDVEGRGTESRLVPATDFDGEITDVAKQFLGYEEAEEKPIDSVRMQYTTEGLDNKREIALTVPTIEPWNESDEIHFGDAGEGRAVAWVRFGETTEPTEEKVVYNIEEFGDPEEIRGNQIYRAKGDSRTSKDFVVYGRLRDGSTAYVVEINEKPISAHKTLEEAREAMNAYYKEHPTTVKHNNRVLVIDEIQSKRHQEGRERGYKRELTADELLEIASISRRRKEIYDKMTDKYGVGIINPENYLGWREVTPEDREELKEFTRLDQRWEDLNDVQKGIPQAPFEKNWMELAMKRMLRLAAEEGYDKVAWTTGEQQAERYNLGKWYDTIERQDSSDDARRYILSGGNVDEIFIDNQNMVVKSSINGTEGKPLAEVVGRDMAVKMEQMNDGDELDNNDLRVGGEGMKGFYDKMLPSFMNKYCKQWGVSVKDVTMPKLDENNTMHSVDVTDQMKEDVMEGQPMFSVKNSQKDADDNQLSLFLQNNTGEYETQDGQTIGFTSLLGAATEASAVRGRDNVQRGDDILSYHLRRLEPGEICHVERRYQKSKMFDFTGSEKIESADDVAYIFNKLEDAAVENSFIVLVKDGKPTIIHTGVGSYGSTYVSAANALVAYKNINPDEVWFVHNHPSGSITSSQPDRDSSKKFEKVFGKKYKGGIIIDTTSGKYGVFDSKSDTASGSTRNAPKNETDIDVYEFSKQVFDKDWNPETSFRTRTHQDVAAFISSHRLGEHDKMSLLVLNNNANIVGNVFLPYTSIGEADIKKLSNDALYYMNQMAGTHVIVYGSFTADDVRAIKTLQKNIENADGRLTDVISTNGDYTGLRSVRMMGAIKEEAQELNENETRFSVGGQQGNIIDEYNRLTGANVGGVSGVYAAKEKALRDWFDGLRPLEQMQDIIEKQMGRKLRDSENAYQTATVATSFSARMIEREQAMYMNPVLNQVADITKAIMDKDGLSYKEARQKFDNYMLAKHGLERNAWFEKNGKDEGDYSGLRGLAESLGENPDNYKDVAEKLVADFENEYSQELDGYWDKMKDLTGRMLEISYESGMISKDKYDELKKRFDYYVPLRGFADGTSADMFDYISRTPHFQNILKKAKGRQSKAEEPLGNLMNMLQSAIVIGNNNKVMQNIYNLAVNSKTDLLRLARSWYVYNDVTDEWEERVPDIPNDATPDEVDAIIKQFEADMKAAKAQGKAKQQLNKLDLAKNVVPYQAKEHEMVAYVDGNKVVIFVNGNPAVAQQFNNGNDKQVGVLAETMQGLTRFASMINTSLSPAFMFTNAARDIGFTLFSATVTGGLKKNVKMVGQLIKAGWVLPRLIITGKMDAGFIKMLDPKEAAKIEQWWNEFVDNGGETGFTRTLSAEKAKAEVNDMIKAMMRGSKDGENRVRKYTLGIIETAGRISEDVSRFAAYSLQRAEGESVKQSIDEAKNVTVNFNVKGGGRLAASCRACYSFFNAALQGINRMGRLAKEHPASFALALTACMLQGAILPWLNMVFFAWLGGDDDDWAKYQYLTEYTANRNLVLYVGNHKFIKIPYAQELAPFAAMGNIFFRQQMGWNKGQSAASQIANMFLDLSPINIGESKTTPGKVLKTITPTIAIPLVEIGLNEDFTGSPIYKRNEWNKYDAAWQKAYEGKTAGWFVDAAKYLDDNTGIDINPAIAEHIFSGVLGGIGRSGDKLVRFFSNGFQMQDAPFIRTMMFDSNPKGYIGAVTREYGRHAFDELPRIKHDMENMTATELAKFVGTEEFEIANLVSTYKTGKDLAGNKTTFQGIDKMEKEYKKAAGMSDGSEAYREQLEAMKAEITEMKMQMLDEISQIQYEHGNDLKQRIRNRVNEVERESKAKAK